MFELQSDCVVRLPQVCSIISIVVLFSTVLVADQPSRQATLHRPILRRGWTIHVDKRLLSGEHAELGRRAIDHLTGKLLRISVSLPKKHLRELRKVPFFLDLDHPLRVMQYHASAKWLREHKFEEAMTRAIQIPNAARFVRLVESERQPWVVMHELAHAYHDRVLGFEDARIKAAYELAKKDSRLANALHASGKRMPHYAMVDHKEFFAEMSEAYLGTNDFYPFNRRQLSEYDRSTFALIRDSWSNK